MLNKILIFNPFGIGDVLFSLPLLETLRTNFPEASVSYLCNARTKPLLEGDPRIEKTFVFEKDDWRSLWDDSPPAFFKAMGKFLGEIKRERFDVCFDLSLNRVYGAILAWIGIPRRIGFNYRGRGFFLTDRIRIDGYHGQHVADAYLELVGKLGAVKPVRSMRLALSKEDEARADALISALGVPAGSPLVALCPGGGKSWGPEAHFKHWPLDRYATLAGRLRKAHGATILVVGDASEQSLGEQVAARGAGIHNLCGKTSVRDLAALLSRCALAICNDGGVLHLAVSVGTPTVSLFGPVDPAVYGPYQADGRHKVLVYESLSCRPCYRNFRFPGCYINMACLREISVTQVEEACAPILK